MLWIYIYIYLLTFSFSIIGTYRLGLTPKSLILRLRHITDTDRIARGTFRWAGTRPSLVTPLPPCLTSALKFPRTKCSREMFCLNPDTMCSCSITGWTATIRMSSGSLQSILMAWWRAMIRPLGTTITMRVTILAGSTSSCKLSRQRLGWNAHFLTVHFVFHNILASTGVFI